MHVYIYDSFLNHKKYDNILARVETRLTDLGLNGKISRLGIMKNIQDSVENELRGGAKTIIAVGDDNTVNRVVNAMAGMNQIGQSIPMGIIPIRDGYNSIAASFGIGSEEEACDILSARRIEKLDVGQANNSFFISNASIANRGTVIEMDQDYSVEVMEEGEVNIVNLATGEKPMPAKAKFDPQDGVLELFIRTKKSKGFLKLMDKEIGQSIFSLESLTIHSNKGLPLILDGSIKIPTPAEISVIKQRLNIIVGKDRSF
jgi:diacylglycerol kinase family enzyme